MLLGCASDSLPWQRYEQEDFPAHVREVVTRLGNVIDAKHSRLMVHGPLVLIRATHPLLTTVRRIRFVPLGSAISDVHVLPKAASLVIGSSLRMPAAS